MYTYKYTSTATIIYIYIYVCVCVCDRRHACLTCNDCWTKDITESTAVDVGVGDDGLQHKAEARADHSIEPKTHT